MNTNLIIYSYTTALTARTSLEFNWHLRSFRVTHYVILNVILYPFYELNDGKLTFFLTSFVKCT